MLIDKIIFDAAETAIAAKFEVASCINEATSAVTGVDTTPVVMGIASIPGPAEVVMFIAWASNQ